LAHSIQNYFLFAFSALLAVASVPAVPAQTSPSGPSVGATVEYRRYEQSADGTITEVGTETLYDSASGNWKKVQRDAQQRMTQTLIADAARGEVYLLLSDTTATSVADFHVGARPTLTQLRQDPQFLSEAQFLGLSVIVSQMKSNSGQLLAQFFRFPDLTHPLKTIEYNDDGSRLVTEAVSIKWGEPSDEVKLPDSVLVTRHWRSKPVKTSN
jgi:hypothetical protein